MGSCFGWKVAGALAASALAANTASATRIPTNLGIGADAEVRESAATQNRGASTELASRVRNHAIAGDSQDGSDRNSAIYTKFDLSDVMLAGPFQTSFEMTYRNNNLSEARIQDDVTPNPALRTGLAIYGLDPNARGANWDESTITYLNAPGITFDGDVGTKDFNTDLLFLGTVLFPEIGTQNHLPIGEALVFQSALLDAFVAGALEQGFDQLTLVSTVIHGGDAPFPAWINFNYLFNPKEQTTLNADAGYDADVTDPNNPLGGPFSGASNADGVFSPALVITAIPEPGTAALAALGLAGLSRLGRRRRDP